jgi:peroxiredoxin (alkyl hydroperoxide reductase subunit C)
MPEEFKPGCQRPPIPKANKTEKSGESEITGKEEGQKLVKVGKPAPEFTAPAFYQGKFVNISLSEFKGKWVLLCFYPGDFTFV